MPARDLPARPSLDQYKKQAKDLLKRWKSDDPTTTRKLADAQFVIAREHGNIVVIKECVKAHFDKRAICSRAYGRYCANT